MNSLDHTLAWRLDHGENVALRRHLRTPVQLGIGISGEDRKKLNDACTSSPGLHVMSSGPYHSQ